MRRLTFVAVALALLLGVPTLSGHGGEPRKADEKGVGLMKRKLASSQKVLEGLAMNDFELISKHADELVLISKEAEWKVMKTPQYEVQSNDFRRAADEMGRSAREKNLDGAALRYVELTLTCVKCHKYVREVRMTSLDGTPGVAGR
jgi:hypothetical protein